MSTPKERLPLRGAIIGFGDVAVHAHLPVWQKNEAFIIDAVVEPHPERAELAGKLLPQARIYSKIEHLFDCRDNIDFVDISTPPCFHDALVLASCRVGLHVFCEKPLATSLESLREITHLANQTQRVVFTVNNWKYAPIWLKAGELIKGGKIGAVRSISLNVLRRPGSGGGASDWRRCKEIARGGIMIDHGWHNLYLILSLIEDFPLSISAKMGFLPSALSGLEETVELAMQFPGAEASVHLTWQAPCRKNFGDIVGEKGTISILDDHLELNEHGSPPVGYDFPEPLSAGSHHPEWMEPVIENFGREIMDKASRGTNLKEAQWCARLVQLAYHSHREASGPVKISRMGT